MPDAPLVLHLRDRTIRFDRTRLMGVLNVTPDSFSDGGRHLRPNAAVQRGLQMIEEGADVVDIGGESTRPGAKPVPAEEEWARLEPVLRGLVKKAQVPLSVDTRKPEVAAKAIAAGAEIVNDVTGLTQPAMREVVQREDVAAVILHMQGDPATMQERPTYPDVVREVHSFFEARLADCEEDGIPKDRLLLDPGIGFGKTVEHNLQLLKRLDEFTDLGVPLLVGTSRKSFLGKIAGGQPLERLEGSLASAVVAVITGAHMLRVHDVAAHAKAAHVVDAIVNA